MYNTASGEKLPPPDEGEQAQDADAQQAERVEGSGTATLTLSRPVPVKWASWCWAPLPNCTPGAGQELADTVQVKRADCVGTGKSKVQVRPRGDLDVDPITRPTWLMLSVPASMSVLPA